MWKNENSQSVGGGDDELHQLGDDPREMTSPRSEDTGSFQEADFNTVQRKRKQCSSECQVLRVPFPPAIPRAHPILPKGTRGLWGAGMGQDRNAPAEVGSPPGGWTRGPPAPFPTGWEHLPWVSLRFAPNKWEVTSQSQDRALE